MSRVDAQETTCAPGARSPWLRGVTTPALTPDERSGIMRDGLAVGGKGQRTDAPLVAIELQTSQDYVRQYFTDIRGDVFLYAVNTTLSTFLLAATALLIRERIVTHLEALPLLLRANPALKVMMVSTLTRAIGARHLALAEESVQDALVRALQQWPFHGVPQDAAAWLARVARNRAIDRLRFLQRKKRVDPHANRPLVAAHPGRVLRAVLDLAHHGAPRAVDGADTGEADVEAEVLPTAPAEAAVAAGPEAGGCTLAVD